MDEVGVMDFSGQIKRSRCGGGARCLAEGCPGRGARGPPARPGVGGRGGGGTLVYPRRVFGNIPSKKRIGNWFCTRVFRGEMCFLGKNVHLLAV